MSIMTDRGDFIAVEVADAQRELPALLRAVEEKRRSIRIFRNGLPVAEMKPSPIRVPDPLAQHPEISGVKAAEDAFAPADEQEWPTEHREPAERPTYSELSGVIINENPAAPARENDWLAGSH